MAGIEDVIPESLDAMPDTLRSNPVAEGGNYLAPVIVGTELGVKEPMLV